MISCGRATASHTEWLQGQARVAWPGQVASTQAPSRRARPLPVRLRRLSAAVRRLSQAWFSAAAAVAELEPASPPGGDLGDGAFDVGPVWPCSPRAARAGGPVRAGGAQQVVALVQDELAAGLAGGAPGAQRAVPAQGAEGGDPGPAEPHGAAGRAGHRAGLLVDGEVIDGEPALDRGRSGLGLITAWCPAVAIAPRRSPVP